MQNPYIRSILTEFHSTIYRALNIRRLIKDAIFVENISDKIMSQAKFAEWLVTEVIIM
jgi:hypothetical protein